MHISSVALEKNRMYALKCKVGDIQRNRKTYENKREINDLWLVFSEYYSQQLICIFSSANVCTQQQYDALLQDTDDWIGVVVVVVVILVCNIICDIEYLTPHSE